MKSSDAETNRVVSIFCETLSSILTVNDATGEYQEVKSASLNSFDGCIFCDRISDDAVVCSVPSLSLNKRAHLPSENASRASLEDAAASSLGEQVDITKQEFGTLSTVLTRNIADSFMQLSESRVRSYVTALSIQSRKEPSSELLPMVEMFYAFSSALVKVKAISVSFRATGSLSKKGKEYITPLVLDVGIALDLFGESTAIELVSSGSASVKMKSVGAKTQKKVRILKANMKLDTKNLLHSLMSKARDAVKQGSANLTQVYIHRRMLQSHEAYETKVAESSLASSNDCYKMSSSNPGIYPPSLPSNTSAEDEKVDIQGSVAQMDSDMKTALHLGSPKVSKAKSERSYGLDLLTKAALCLNSSSDVGDAGTTLQHSQSTF